MLVSIFHFQMEKSDHLIMIIEEYRYDILRAQNPSISEPYFRFLDILNNIKFTILTIMYTPLSIFVM